MIRNIVQIDGEKCNGCGLCAQACHESAIEMIDGKAKLIRDDYCDGLGNCLPVCPTGAISIIKREADPYDEETVLKNIAAQKTKGEQLCPGIAVRKLNSVSDMAKNPGQNSALSHWPVQLRLAAPNAAFFDNADLLIAADCTAYAYANFHQDFIQGNTTLIACPKLDDANYIEKLAEIIQTHSIRSIHVVRMEVPCCGGICHIVKKALELSGKSLPLRTTILTTDGKAKDAD